LTGNHRIASTTAHTVQGVPIFCPYWPRYYFSTSAKFLSSSILEEIVFFWGGLTLVQSTNVLHPVLFFCTEEVGSDSFSPKAFSIKSTRGLLEGEVGDTGTVEFRRQRAASENPRFSLTSLTTEGRVIGVGCSSSVWWIARGAIPRLTIPSSRFSTMNPNFN
jgi:hypothetical protein